MMAIYQIYKQRKNINSFYTKMNHEIFRKPFFVSKNDQASEYQGKDELEYIHKNQQPDDAISSKNTQASENRGKDGLKDLSKNHLLEKNSHKDVEGNENPIDEARKKIVLPDGATSDKSNPNTNQGKDVLKD